VPTIYALLSSWLMVLLPIGGGHRGVATDDARMLGNEGGVVVAQAAPDPRSYTLAMPTAQMVSVLRAELFVDSGRMYPCRGNPACSSWGHDLALSAPGVKVDGPRLVFSVHVAGSYAINAMFAPSIAGDLIVSAVPVARDGLIHVTQSAVQAAPTSDIVFQGFVQTVHGQIEQMLNDKGTLDLAQYLAMSAKDPKLPPPRLPGVSCVEPSQIQVQSVATDPAASAVKAMVTVSPPAAGSRGC
jgi:hypothetical protein